MEVDTKLSEIIRDLHFMARRYANGRTSYIVDLFNEHTRQLQYLGLSLDSADGTVFAIPGEEVVDGRVI